MRSTNSSRPETASSRPCMSADNRELHESGPSKTLADSTIFKAWAVIPSMPSSPIPTIKTFSAATGPPLHLTAIVDQAWNELPQPQLFEAFGLLKVKPRLSIPSWKSSVVPSRKRSLFLSTTTAMPCWSVFVSAFGSN